MTILVQQQLRELAQAAPHKDWRAGNYYDKPFLLDVEVLADTPDGLMVVMQGNQNFAAESVAAVAFVGAASPAAVLALLDEIDRLEHSRKIASANRDHLARELRHALDRQERLQAESAELRRDAERYRYLRDGACTVATSQRKLILIEDMEAIPGDFANGGEMLDAAIDQAMTKEQQA